MSNLTLFYFLALIVVLIQAQTFTYTNHGTDWNLGVCLTGKQQSPLKLSEAGISIYNNEKAKLIYNYQDLKNTSLNISTNKYNLFINTTSALGGNITYLDELGNEYFYALEQIFFKYPSEHWLEGKQYTAEMQFVHRSLNNKSSLAIVSVLLDSSKNLVNDFFLDLDPNTVNINKNRTSIPIKSKLFDQFYGNFYHYNGSLTQPYCNETVRWLVFSVPIQITTYYATQLYNLIGSSSYTGNYRVTQSLTNRTIELVSKMSYSDYRYFKPYNHESSYGGYIQASSLAMVMIIAILNY